MKAAGLRLGACALLALCLVALGLLARHNLYLSEPHAQLIAKGVALASRGEPELFARLYPHLPLLAVAAWPTSLGAMLTACLIASALAWALFREMRHRRASPPAAALAVVAIIVTPCWLYIATQSLADTLLLLIGLLSWTQYRRFVVTANTRAGFIAGMTLGLGMFDSPYVFALVSVYLLLIPFMARRRGPGFWCAAGMVVAFPSVFAAGVMLFLGGVFAGDPWQWLVGIGQGVVVYAREPGADAVVGWVPALQSVAAELVLCPIVAAVAMLLGWRRPRRLPMLILIPCGAVLLRALGMTIAVPLSIAACCLVAILCLDGRILQGAAAGGVLTLGAAAQLAAGIIVDVPMEISTWQASLVVPQARSAEEFEAGRYLAGLPRRSVLVDERVSYRALARAETAAPFVLTGDSIYTAVASQPAMAVPYVLVPLTPSPLAGSKVATRYAMLPPSGFSEGPVWSCGRLYALRQVASATDGD